MTVQELETRREKATGTEFSTHDWLITMLLPAKCTNRRRVYTCNLRVVAAAISDRVKNGRFKSCKSNGACWPTVRNVCFKTIKGMSLSNQILIHSIVEL